MMELFHVLNRGVDKRKIFLDNQDHFRFIHNLYEFNDEDRVEASSYYFNQSFDIGCRKIERRQRKLLVEVHAFCLMPNHYHLLLSSRVDSGIPKFMKKINMGYSKYFNLKNNRSGTLFEGKYKSIFIKEEAQFIHIPYYIHLNPLDLCLPEWRERKMTASTKAFNFLENYRWSSYLDYIGQKNFPSVTSREFLSNFCGGPKKYKLETFNWLKEMEFTEIKAFALE